MNFKLFALITATLVSAQGSALQVCKGDRWNNQLSKAIYVDQVKGFVTKTNGFVQRSSLPPNHRVVGPKYIGDYAYLENRLTITVDEKDAVVSLACN